MIVGKTRALSGKNRLLDSVKWNSKILKLTSSPITANNFPLPAECIVIVAVYLFKRQFNYLLTFESLLFSNNKINFLRGSLRNLFAKQISWLSHAPYVTRFPRNVATSSELFLSFFEWRDDQKVSLQQFLHCW